MLEHREIIHNKPKNNRVFVWPGRGEVSISQSDMFIKKVDLPPPNPSNPSLKNQEMFSTEFYFQKALNRLSSEPTTKPLSGVLCILETAIANRQIFNE